jgi:hypothetical protein
MKSTRRHELQTNVLADTLGRLIVRLKPHARPIVYGGALAVLLVFVLLVLPAMRGTTTPEAGASAAFLRSLAPSGGDQLRAFLADYPEAVQAPAARIALGCRLYRRAVRGADVTGDPIPTSRAAQDLADAKEQFSLALAEDPALEPMARLMLALITVHEGDLEAGVKRLREVVERWPQSEAAAGARLHAARLEGYRPVAFSDEPLEPPKKEGEDRRPAAPPIETGVEGPEGRAPADQPEQPPPAGPGEPKPNTQE